MIRSLNEANLHGDDPEFAARISAYDTAFKMQTEAPEVFDLSKEPKETLELYGVGEPTTDDYGRRCLLARRMVEKGVRFMCGFRWRSGQSRMGRDIDIEQNHSRWHAGRISRSSADQGLKRRGMLDSTLCYGAASSAARPESEKSNGRDHHNTGFSMWVAGGGFKGGTVYGATDDIGLKATEKPVHFRDLHTTMLYQIGLNQDVLELYVSRTQGTADGSARGNSQGHHQLTGGGILTAGPIRWILIVPLPARR